MNASLEVVFNFAGSKLLRHEEVILVALFELAKIFPHEIFLVREMK